MRILLGWWNAGLSLPRGGKASAVHHSAAIDVIAKLLESGIDVLGLCEVSLDDIKVFEEKFGRRGFGILHAQDAAGKSKFDMALVYRIDRLACDGPRPWTSAFGGRTFKIGCKFDLELPGKTISLIMAHWPSRRFYPADTKNRDRIASEMRVMLDDLLSGANKDVILMGDFNDEPFNRNMASILLALRDRTQAAAAESLFYNPFWNFVGSRPRHGSVETQDSISGTHFYRLDHTECWWTFDQIIFSSSFVSAGSWQLDESVVGLYEPRDLMDRVRSKDGIDHLPVFAAIRRNEE